jgi:hypothetical protein
MPLLSTGTDLFNNKRNVKDMNVSILFGRYTHLTGVEEISLWNSRRALNEGISLQLV